MVEEHVQRHVAWPIELGSLEPLHFEQKCARQPNLPEAFWQKSGRWEKLPNEFWRLHPIGQPGPTSSSNPTQREQIIQDDSFVTRRRGNLLRDKPSAPVTTTCSSQIVLRSKPGMGHDSRRMRDESARTSCRAEAKVQGGEIVT